MLLTQTIPSRKNNGVTILLHPYLLLHSKLEISNLINFTIFYSEFYNKIEQIQILRLGDEAGYCFSVDLVKSVNGREVFYISLLKFQVRYEGF